MHPIELMYLAGWLLAMIVAKRLGGIIDCNEYWYSMLLGLCMGIVLMIMAGWGP